MEGYDGEGGDGEGAEAAAKESTKRRRGNYVDDQFRVSTKAVAQHGSIFEGRTYCVLESEFAHTPSGGRPQKFTREDVSLFNRYGCCYYYYYCCCRYCDRKCVGSRTVFRSHELHLCSCCPELSVHVFNLL